MSDDYAELGRDHLEQRAAARRQADDEQRKAQQAVTDRYVAINKIVTEVIKPECEKARGQLAPHGIEVAFDTARHGPYEVSVAINIGEKGHYSAAAHQINVQPNGFTIVRYVVEAYGNPLTAAKTAHNTSGQLANVAGDLGFSGKETINAAFMKQLFKALLDARR